MEKKLIIVGAGGFGRETFYLAKDNNWVIKGFIDDNLNALDGVNIAASVIGTISDWIVSEDEVFAIGISSPRMKEIVINKMKGKGAIFISLISPKADVNETAILGEGVIVTAGSIGDCARIGNYVHIAGSMVGQDCVIGDYSTVTGFANTVTSKIGRRVFVGSQAVLLANVEDDAYICAGSVVLKRVKTGTRVLGNPAKRIELI